MLKPLHSNTHYAAPVRSDEYHKSRDYEYVQQHFREPNDNVGVWQHKNVMQYPSYHQGLGLDASARHSQNSLEPNRNAQEYYYPNHSLSTVRPTNGLNHASTSFESMPALRNNEQLQNTLRNIHSLWQQQVALQKQISNLAASLNVDHRLQNDRSVAMVPSNVPRTASLVGASSVNHTIIQQQLSQHQIVPVLRTGAILGQPSIKPVIIQPQQHQQHQHQHHNQSVPVMVPTGIEYPTFRAPPNVIPRPVSPTESRPAATISLTAGSRPLSFPPATDDKRKTELCRSWEETGICKYSNRCRFAHGIEELRALDRHPKYKTRICKTFWDDGVCPYGIRCCFIHAPNTGGSRMSDVSSPVTSVGSPDLYIKDEMEISRLEPRLSDLPQPVFALARTGAVSPPIAMPLPFHPSQLLAMESDHRAMNEWRLQRPSSRTVTGAGIQVDASTVGLRPTFYEF